MARESLTGSRIRERRVMAGIKQADLAKRSGISASYLNLIEHDRRRIGGKLLLNIAAELNVEPQALTDGAEAALLGTLREAALDAHLAEPEAGRADEFAGRFPGWAEVLAASRRRIATLERTVETLSDRMAHDPHLAASMHELLTTAAAIRSTAAILAETKTLEPEWRDRFHTNIDADSRRLADSAQALVGYLELDSPQDVASSPQEEVESFLQEHRYHFAELEGASGGAITDVLNASPNLRSKAAHHIAERVLEQVARDAQKLPLIKLEAAIAQADKIDPVALARDVGAPLAVILRRLAALPALGAGLVVCDRSGTVIFRKSVAGFSVPRFGACCPLWPLFSVLGQPGLVVRDRVQQLGRNLRVFDAFAVAEQQSAPAYNTAPLVQAVMLILPVPPGQPNVGIHDVGSTCRICPHDACTARREPSILTGTPDL
ncbi:transcriptional regulator [Sulfitobacter sp. SK012]|uniref:helix-turn-helix transcriptional regulator n=1 Tax=Sulfitobacter sp. SK012 TaxID=1389005 RepID=UPI000E0A30B2|nr:helix-turn-helix transcriptional regulator [Sulfitobacter sp. SK012]AXI47076.1 transcriptional regulator [Sulfitobacter sp. SK012]